MRLVTHNLLQCHVKGCDTNNFPLELSEIECESQETDFNPQFLRTMVPKLEWDALVRTAMKLGITTLPDKVPDTPIQELDEKFLRNLHTVLFETHIQQGKMTCPNCQHVYPIKDGIPNMLLNDNEV